MKPRTKIATAETSDGTVLELFEHDGAHEISIGGNSLMGTRQHNSEEELARFACEELPEKPVVLIGGLGIGYTLRAALDLLPADGEVIVVELLKEIVEWNKGLLSHHADNPLADPRTKLVIGDVTNVIKRYEGQLAAIMLDVDNGAAPMVMTKNRRLYAPMGLKQMRNALIPGGALAIWSAGDDPQLVERVKRARFEVKMNEAHARPNRKGARHCILIGRKSRKG